MIGTERRMRILDRISLPYSHWQSNTRNKRMTTKIKKSVVGSRRGKRESQTSLSNFTLRNMWPLLDIWWILLYSFDQQEQPRITEPRNWRPTGLPPSPAHPSLLLVPRFLSSPYPFKYLPMRKKLSPSSLCWNYRYQTATVRSSLDPHRSKRRAPYSLTTTR